MNCINLFPLNERALEIISITISKEGPYQYTLHVIERGTEADTKRMMNGVFYFEMDYKKIY